MSETIGLSEEVKAIFQKIAEMEKGKSSEIALSLMTEVGELAQAHLVELGVDRRHTNKEPAFMECVDVANSSIVLYLLMGGKMEDFERHLLEKTQKWLKNLST